MEAQVDWFKREKKKREKKINFQNTSKAKQYIN